MSQKQPNVIIFFADDLGIGDVSAFNSQAQFKTENIDRLAEMGMKFTDSHATSSLCTPSRYGLLTGRYNWRSRLKSSVVPGDSAALIEKGRKTLAQMLKDHGYQTAAIGKWHLGMEWAFKDKRDYEGYNLDGEHFEKYNADHQKGRPYFGNRTGEQAVRGIDIDFSQSITYGPNEYGFDYFFGTPASLDQGPYVIVENDHVLYEPVYPMGSLVMKRRTADGPRDIELGVAAPEYSVREIPKIMQGKAMEVLEDFATNDAPFFLYYPNHLVHGPLVPQPEFEGKSGVGPYGDFVLQMDSYVGEIMNWLIEKDLMDNTIFIFTSDNGVSPVDDIEGLKAQGHDPSMGYRGTKFDIWDGGHREPLIVSWPDQIQGATVSNHLVSLSDIYATLAEIVGEEIGDDTAEDSYSNLSLWQGDDEPVRETIIHSSANGGFAIRRDFYKLIMVEEGGSDSSYDQTRESYQKVFRPTQLYDLRDDISETNNIIADHPDLVKDLIQTLAEDIKRGRTTQGARQANAPDLPFGHWEQLIWLDDYDDYIAEVNRDYLDQILDEGNF